MKRMLVFAFLLALFMVFAAVAPAMAVSPKKIPVTVTRSMPSFVQGNFWYTEGGTYHVRHAEFGFGTYTVTGEGVSLSGYSTSSFNGNLNLKTNVGDACYRSQLIFADGTFEGIITNHGEMVIIPNTYPIPTYRGYLLLWNGAFRGVWHGTDDYQGWTMVLDYETANGAAPAQVTGYLLIP